MTEPNSTPHSNPLTPMEPTLPSKETSTHEYDEIREYLKELRNLATHEGEITNHRIQWFALLNGLLFATFGLLWEFRDTSKEVLIVVSVMGVVTSITCWAALRLGGLACESLFKKQKAVLGKMTDAQMIENRIPPIMGYESPLGWQGFVMPWFLLGPLFTAAWIVVLAVALCRCMV